MEQCVIEDKDNLALSICTTFFQFPKGMITMPENARIPAATLASGAAAVLTYIQNKLLAPKAERWYFFPEFDGAEWINKEPAYEDNTLAYAPVDPGAYRLRAYIAQGQCIHNRLYTHFARSGRVMLIDKAGNGQVTKFSNGDVSGVKVQLINPENIRFTDGSSVQTASPIVVAMRDTVEINRYGALLAVNTGELYRVVDVGLTLVGDNTATEIVVDIKSLCDSQPVSGFVAADFLLIDDADGLPHAIADVDEDANTPGRYTITGVAFEASKLSLKAASVLTIKAYETPETLTIPAP